MLKNILSLALSVFVAIVVLGLLVVLFSIGLVALWYLLLIAALVWAIRWLYYLIKGQKPPKVMQQYDYYYARYTDKSKKPRQGRTIDHE